MQFVFPIYIQWSIAGLMIFSVHNSKMMTKLFGNNCVQVLATLFLLSYSKLLRTIITIMVPAVLYIYPLKYEQWSETQLVWAFDGNLSYCGNPHGFLFVVALLTLMALWLPYTVFLLFFKIIMKGSSHKKIELSLSLRLTVDITYYYWVARITQGIITS